jgi:N-acetylglucosamine transport system permease protein
MMTPRRGSGGRPGRPDLCYVVGTQTAVWLLSVSIVVPLLWIVLSSFKTSKEILSSPLSLPADWSFDNYTSAWTTAHVGEYYLNTVVVVFVSVALVMLLGAMCAYVLAVFEFPGRMALVNLMLISMAFPIFLAIVPLYRLMRGLELVNTLLGLIMVYVAFALPFTVFFLYSFFRGLPRDVYEAARIDGATEWRIFFTVMLPMVAPGMGAVSLFNLVGLWNQYLLPLALMSDQKKFVLTQGMQAFAQIAGRSVNLGALFAAVVMTVLPLLALYIVFQKRLAGSVSLGTFR